MNKIIWKNQKRKVSELKSFEGNPRKANEKEIQDLDKSLSRFNLADPLVINTDGEVIGGNFRLSRLKEKGIKEVDVRIPSRILTRKEAEELNLRLNKNQGSWDNEVLANFSEDLLLDAGWNKDELDEIFGLETVDDFDEGLLNCKKCLPPFGTYPEEGRVYSKFYWTDTIVTGEDWDGNSKAIHFVEDTAIELETNSKRTFRYPVRCIRDNNE